MTTTIKIEHYEEGAAVQHGSYTLYATIPFSRHYYAGSGCEDSPPRGYVEVLVFPEPPPAKPRVLIHRKKGKNRHAFHFADLQQAMAAAESTTVWMVELDGVAYANVTQTFRLEDLDGFTGLERFGTIRECWFMRTH